MAQELLTLCKLLILYMLNQVEFPLTTAQVSEFILGRNYASYYSLQQALDELPDAGLIQTETVRNRTFLTITGAGKETLGYLSDRINPEIKKDTLAYFHEHEIKLRNEHSIAANYYRSTSGEYEVHMTAKEGKLVLIDLTLSVPDQKMAQGMCEKWERRNQEIYQYLMEQLL
ncbi:MAG: DUF4364 family protein [Lachnospiraceae bacterium]|nr:DUF4364 family protein [Lachnospiraceae bacterium]